jgi:hypothetical protein
MLGSAHEGEILAAARAAERIRHDAGMSWREILDPAPSSAAEWADEVKDDPVGFCLARAQRLTDWERNFLSSIQRQRYRLSDKQCRVLRTLVAKVWGSP